jgi:hypothetical protein
MKVLLGMKLRYLLPVALLLVVVLTAACAAPPPLRNQAFLNDTSLIDGEPCGPPCFRGITPGETAWSEAMTILEDDPNITDIQVEADEETNEVAASFQRPEGVTCCLAYSENGSIVDQMLLQLAPDMTVGDVIGVHGEPAYLTGVEVSSDQASAALYYPDMQTIVYAFVEGVQGQLTAASEVFAVLYVRQSDMDRVIQNSELYRWDGYQGLSDYLNRPVDITPVPTGVGADGAATPEAETEG